MNTALPGLLVRYVPFANSARPLGIYRKVRPIDEPAMAFCESPEVLERALAQLGHLDWRLNPAPGDALRWAYPAALVRAQEAGASLSRFGASIAEGSHPDLDPIPNGWIPRASQASVLRVYGMGERHVSMVWRWEFTDAARVLWSVVPTDEGVRIFCARELLNVVATIPSALRRATDLGATR